MAQSDTAAGKIHEPKPLRLWPGVLLVTLQWLARFALPMVAPGATVFAVLAGLACGLAIVVWWAFLSRAPRSERWGAVALMTVALLVTSRVIQASVESVETGMTGMMFVIFVAPVLSLAFVVWAVASRRLSDGYRRATMVATIVLACGVWTLVRSGGTTGVFGAEFAWRWAETSEERLLAQPGDELMAVPSASAPPETEAYWPGYRGPDRDGVVPGVQIDVDWSTSPPVELWRRPVGPGWSSFAVRGGLLYTQEQRGNDEIVACYHMTTGEPLWRHRDDARFWEAYAGAGPRATPTLSDGRVYAFGATGILNALDAENGDVVWSQNAASDTGAQTPTWGFASSPLVVGEVVVVYTDRLVAYEVATGDLRWSGPAGGVSYGSPHLLTVAGVAQILMLSGHGARSVAPVEGTLLWESRWPVASRIMQPALTANGDLLIDAGEQRGVRRISVTHGSGGWAVEERWTSARLKPYFNDFVVHEGYVFGFDGSILACIDAQDGKRKWKGGRYGHGQLVLLPDQDVLLVLSEQGELALVAAAADRFTELAKFQAIDGKTWNHPVLVGDVLLVRNGEEMGAFRLPLARSTPVSSMSQVGTTDTWRAINSTQSPGRSMAWRGSAWARRSAEIPECTLALFGPAG